MVDRNECQASFCNKGWTFKALQLDQAYGRKSTIAPVASTTALTAAVWCKEALSSTKMHREFATPKGCIRGSCDQVDGGRQKKEVKSKTESL